MGSKFTLIIVFFIFLLVLSLVIYGAYSLYKSKKSKSQFIEDNTEQIVLNLKARDILNHSIIFGVDYCIYNGDLEQITCKKINNAFDWDTTWILRKPGETNYFVRYKKQGKYLSEMTLFILQEGTRAFNQYLDMTRACAPEVNVTGDTRFPTSKLSMDIYCKEGKLNRPIVCMNWSPGYVKVVNEKNIVTCNLYQNLPFFQGYWKNFTEFKFNDTTKKFDIEWLSNNLRQCGEGNELYGCSEINDRECMLELPKPPDRLFNIANACFVLPGSLISWDGDRNFVQVNWSIKSFQLIPDDYIDMYIIDSGCSNEQDIKNFFQCVYGFEDNQGRDIGGKDIIYKVKYGIYNHTKINSTFKNE